MFYQIFLSPQVKQSLIISNKLVYTSCLMRCRTTYDLRSQEIRKVQNSVKTSWKYDLVPSFPPKKLNFSRNSLFRMKTRVSLKYLVRACSSNSLVVKGNCAETWESLQIFWPELYIKIIFGLKKGKLLLRIKSQPGGSTVPCHTCSLIEIKNQTFEAIVFQLFTSYLVSLRKYTFDWS